jgi:hypothetical protein
MIFFKTGRPFLLLQELKTIDQLEDHKSQLQVQLQASKIEGISLMQTLDLLGVIMLI